MRVKLDGFEAHLAQILKSAFTQGKKISPNPLANTQSPLKLVIVES